MGFKFGYSDKNSDDFEVFISSVDDDVIRTEEDMLREGAAIVKQFVIANLNRHRRPISVRYKDRPAMADDVVIRKRTDKYGDMYIRVMGDKATGTLWHLVNDGNLHSQPTHFMDGALLRLDNSIDKLWDDILGGK